MGTGNREEATEGMERKLLLHLYVGHPFVFASSALAAV
jgi:hypothetical protein